jgi:hypothetical protein
MKLPNADNAEIAPSKLTEYLLNPMHRRGGGKANLLISSGYQSDNWQQLEADLRRQHLTADVTDTRTTEYGQRFEIVASLNTPSGRALLLRSVWQIDTGTDHPRLITIYPE